MTRLTTGSGGTVRLIKDVTAGSADQALVIPAGCKATLDLNGHTVDRALQEAVAEGSVFIVMGDLTITDSSAAGTGRITGGRTTTSGGGVRANKGTVTLKGGTITGNQAYDSWGGGVYLYDKNSVFRFNGGAITGNTAGRNGGGLHASENCVCGISGNIMIDGNYVNGSPNNLNLAKGAVLQATEALAKTADIHVCTSVVPTDSASVLAVKDLDGKGSVTNFISDWTNCFGKLNGSGDLVLCRRTDAGEALRPGDLALYSHGGAWQIKRVIAAAGDRVVVSGDGEVRVNGTVIEESYAAGNALDTGIPARRINLDAGEIFVLGDERSLSVDSRSAEFGVVREEDVIGTAEYVLWPLYRTRSLKQSEPAEQMAEEGGSTP